MSRIRINHRILAYKVGEVEFSGDPGINLSDTVFEFLSEDNERLSSISSSYCEEEEEQQQEQENENDNINGNAKDDDKNSWETQLQLLQATISRTSCLESRIRKTVKEALNEAQHATNVCACRTPEQQGCRKCLMEHVCRRLQNSGFNSAICRSKWRSSPDIPSGEHTFLDVIDTSNPKKGEVRVIIELNFRAEFELARANPEYDKLVKALPEIFIGKIERLLALLKILCTAAKRCMKARKQHMGPWRKHRYMQAKWLKTCGRFAAAQPLCPEYGYTVVRTARPRVSLLTVGLKESFADIYRPAAVEAV
ncbi:hypothetical protein F511_15074 [Dorcoceras hygrometricum]|uniref:Uncharacterized protein n=1 Tax=Dorcoceras hygrometricum TaxID=472368 RepID=A0A2Z7BRZ0_9LAMI|nr:hypothetical protein F511_15074 [Dorcoceras hygrometricum]